MSNYLMKIHPRLAKCGRRLGMGVPWGTEPTSPGLVVDIRAIVTRYVPNEPWMTCSTECLPVGRQFSARLGRSWHT